VFRHIWVAQHDSEGDDAALSLAVWLARSAGARLTICHVIPPGAEEEPVDEHEQIMRALVGEGETARCSARINATATWSAPDVSVHGCLAAGRPDDVLLDLLRSAHPDIAVVAARRRRLRWLRGRDAAARLADDAPCPVMIIRH
jgi:nucleotide-binding universal stress UspA family protein